MEAQARAGKGEVLVSLCFVRDIIPTDPERWRPVLHDIGHRLCRAPGPKEVCIED